MPRPLHQQTIVITGASSGIGRETAQEAGKRGANVVLAARSVPALREVARAIEAAGGRALVVPTDVGDRAQVERLAGAAVEHFGRIDTWVNNASVSVYATVEETTPEEFARVVQVNLMGTVYGCQAALPYLRQQGGGTIINVSSTLAERAVPLQVAYCAAKHAVKGFTEGLRLELARERGSGIHVVQVLPSSINTPFFDHARSKLGVRPSPIPPVYDPRVAAEAILFAAEHPRRDIYAGGFGRLLSVMGKISGPLTDRYMLLGDQMFRQQKSDRPDDGRDGLFAPREDGPNAVRGDYSGMVLPVSPYTRFLELHPNRKRLVAAALLAGAAALLTRRRTGRGTP